MVYLALAALLGGVAYGMSGLEIPLITLLTENTQYILYALMFFVGISVGLHRGLWTKMRQYDLRVLLIPGGIIAGSLLGGMLCSLLTGLTLREAAAIGSGMGWYSLSGVMLTEMGGAQVGSIAFLSNLMREIFSFFCIPQMSRRLNYYTCIAPAGATSEDTTLPMMIRFTNEETVVLSVLNGILCSAMVPVLIRLCWSVF